MINFDEWKERIDADLELSGKHITAMRYYDQGIDTADEIITETLKAYNNVEIKQDAANGHKDILITVTK